MGGLRSTPLLLAATVLAACGERQGEAPTAPELAGKPTAGCNFTTLSTLVKNEFGASSNEARLAGDFKNLGEKTEQGTFVGYQIIAAVAAKFQTAPAGTLTANANQLLFEDLKCMNVGTPVLPESFEPSLGPTGALGVVGFTSTDKSSVISHDAGGSWRLSPPPNHTWWDITKLVTSLTTEPVKHVAMVFGNSVDDPNFTQDQPLSGVFNWEMIPTGSFDKDPAVVGVIVAECTHPTGYLQHNPAGFSPEVLGFIKPDCFVEETVLREPGPRTFAERLFRLLAPQPAMATLVGGTGSAGGKGTLSPFIVAGPGFVNLDPQFTWRKSGNRVNAFFDPTPAYQIRSAAGTPFRQDFVFIWLEAFGNSGSKVAVCNNWGYTDANGVAEFPQSYLNKAGGYTMIAKTRGTVSKPEVTGQFVPTVPPGASILSSGINVKNDVTRSPPDDCPTFVDGQPLPPPITN
jgi:hypothetical protein